MIRRLLPLACCVLPAVALAQQAPQPASPAPITGNDNAPGRMTPAYPMPYQRPSAEAVKVVMDRLLGYIERQTPVRIVDAQAHEITLDQLDATSKFNGGFGLATYEWGVTYAGAIRAGQVTGDDRYTRYAADRINFVADIASRYRAAHADPTKTPVRGMLAPGRLDDAGAMAAAFIKAQRAGLGTNLRPQIDVYLDWVANKQFRLKDGTLARNNPLPSILWLDDMYMSIPALAQMGALTGQRRYFDDAVRQVLQFSQHMFVPETGLYRHGWVQAMDTHPAYHWGRANGWAAMAMVELLEVLPANHPGRAAVLKQLRAQFAGLLKYQSKIGLWHQLIERSDSYLETSGSAMFAYAIAHAVNRGWVDRGAFAPVALLAWQGVSTQVNATGEVENVTVGTGMAMDAAFYYYRPVDVHAAHGYGPVLLAGAEIIQLLKTNPPMYGGNGTGVLFK